MSDDERRSYGGASPPPEEEEGGVGCVGGADEDEVDEDTLRIMVSTDNHLGYAERDPIRGLDSFAAFEEVLALAKRHKCDMVLLAGDLFHDNKPSRRTLHKTMEIVRRYCMGPQPVQFQIVSDQAENFRGPTGTVNYEDEHYSIDLPIFSIHGNHDDPTRDGGTEMLAALDLMAVSNLVNYFGRQDEVDKVEVAPVLIKKGDTNVAIYGMGSMRDERLNRMWQGKNVRFLEPEVAADREDGDDEEGGGAAGWFNVFALHQNRDLGRGAKNCVHESMIPEWMDLVVWGHEHECQINPTESAVGTFRITQPGSSVATSLTVGEAERKQVGILDVRGQSFRMRPVPLSQVRPFATGEISLREESADALDPEDPNIDDAIADVLAEHVTALVEEAREQAKALREDAEAAAREAMPLGTADLGESGDGTIVGQGQKYKLAKPDQVLVRLKVEHSGFGTLNNQRFGSRFVKEVANPSDILLFHRRKQVESVKNKSKSNSKRGGIDKPLEPEELAEINVEDLIKENLEVAEKKLQVLDERRLGVALDDFVSKEQRQAISETVQDELKRSQRELIRRNRDGEGEGGGSKITTAAAVREVCMAKADRARNRMEEEGHTSGSSKRKHDATLSEEDRGDDEDVVMNGDKDGDDSENEDRGKTNKASKKGTRRGASSKEDSDDDSFSGSHGKKGAAKRARAASSAKTKGSSTSRAASSRSAARSRGKIRYEESSEDDDVEVIETPAPSAARKTKSRAAAASSSRPSRRASASSARGRYKDNGSGSESDVVDDDFVDSPAEEKDDDLSDMEVVEEVAPKKKGRRGRAAPASSAKKQSTLSAKSFTSARKPRATSGASTGRRKRTAAAYYEDDDSDDGGDAAAGLGAGWGTASSQASHSSRRSRRR